jgi:16S rRNA (cytidine1402-2'-O)-methyltransferase
VEERLAPLASRLLQPRQEAVVSWGDAADVRAVRLMQLPLRPLDRVVDPAARRVERLLRGSGDDGVVDLAVPFRLPDRGDDAGEGIQRRASIICVRRTLVLYLVATPIGNLGDITMRALEVLRSVDLIACEDTRVTRKLLSHYAISKPLLAFHEHNERHAGARILQAVREGRKVAVVSDAGTPGVSDPGFTLVRSALAEQLPVTMVPGPAAFVMAVILSGLATHAFTFRGFPPRKSGPRKRFLAVDRESPHTLVFYESAHRLIPFLADALAVLGDRRAAVANELTKMFERFYRGSLSELLALLESQPLRGEFCVIVEGAGADAGADVAAPSRDDEAT